MGLTQAWPIMGHTQTTSVTRQKSHIFHIIIIIRYDAKDDHIHHTAKGGEFSAFVSRSLFIIIAIVKYSSIIIASSNNNWDHTD